MWAIFLIVCLARKWIEVCGEFGWNWSLTQLTQIVFYNYAKWNPFNQYAWSIQISVFYFGSQTLWPNVKMKIVISFCCEAKNKFQTIIMFKNLNQFVRGWSRTKFYSRDEVHATVVQTSLEYQCKFVLNCGFHEVFF